MIILPILTTSLVQFLFNRLGESLPQSHIYRLFSLFPNLFFSSDSCPRPLEKYGNPVANTWLQMAGSWGRRCWEFRASVTWIQSLTTRRKSVASLMPTRGALRPVLLWRRRSRSCCKESTGTKRGSLMLTLSQKRRTTTLANAWRKRSR